MNKHLAAALLLVVASPLFAAPPDNTFTLDTPKGEWGLTQGDDIVFTATVHRGNLFKQNVKLNFKTDESVKGVTIVPNEVVIDAANPNTTVHFIVRAAINAPVALDTISVVATPQQGPPVATTFTIRVKKR